MGCGPIIILRADSLVSASWVACRVLWSLGFGVEPTGLDFPPRGGIQCRRVRRVWLRPPAGYLWFGWLCRGVRCPGSRCGGLSHTERGQGRCSLFEVVVCGLGLRSLAWVVWLAGVWVLWLAGSYFGELVVCYGAVPLHRAMGVTRVVRIG